MANRPASFPLKNMSLQELQDLLSKVLPPIGQMLPPPIPVAGLTEIAGLATTAVTKLTDAVHTKFIDKLSKEDVTFIGHHVNTLGSVVTVLISRLADAERRAAMIEAQLETTRRAKRRRLNRAGASEEETGEDGSEEDVENGAAENREVPVAPPATTVRQPPTDDEITNYVKEIVKDADLNVVTLKIVCSRVFNHFSEFDLSHKRDLIKETTKSFVRHGVK